MYLDIPNRSTYVKMEMVEVDRQLFVTCRLCLGDLGVYQIVPQVQQQIKYCFDIDVELFDGLPQLICKKCKTILQEYFHIKQTFIEKQATLKKKLTNKNEEASNEGNHDDVREDSPCPSAQDTEESIQQIPGKRKRLRLPSSSSSDQNTDHYEIVKKRHKSSKSPTWKNYYKRKFVCQLCSKICKKKNSLTKHLRKHNILLSKYPYVYSRDCKVELIKIDDNPNVTGTNDNVVVSVDRILSSNEGSNNYCVIYTPKKDCSERRLNSSDGCENNQDVNGDSSDDDLTVKKDSRIRSRTRSSNETVILNNDNADEPENIKKVISDEDESTNLNDAECIKIDDSSDSESTKSNRVLRDSTDINPIKTKSGDIKAIQNILSVCVNRYLKKIECAENDLSKGPALDEAVLKRIILNMGQKVVSKQAVNCTGLLRFMENSDLNIKWIQAKSPKNVLKESSYVYIQPKLVNKLNKTEPGWTNISARHTLPVNHLFTTEDSDGHQGYSKNGSNSTLPTGIVSTMDKVHGKLLNKSPVANPKQLPKKTYTNQSSDNADQESVFATEEVNNDNSSMPMPIITSTTSLAVISNEAQETVSAIENSVVSNENVNEPFEESIENSAVLMNKNVEESIENTLISNNVNEPEKNTPRIKVKPDSELMSDRVLKTLSQKQQVNTANIWDTPHSSNIQPVAVNHIPILVPNGTNSFPVEGLQIVPYQCVERPAGAAAPAAREHVVLDTVELPNYSTDSPFRYVKSLLQIHNLVLLDTHETLTRDFVCLIKFKLQFKQENVDEPVVLFLSFQCFGNKFYLGVKHNEQENNIDLSKLPANWQWEIINKVYREEVVNKVLKNAQKISQSTHDYAKSFLCLLKSIKKLDFIT